MAQDDSRAAATIAHQIEKTVDRIARLPLSALGPIPAVLIGRYKFRILYVVQGDELIIRNVRRTRGQLGQNRFAREARLAGAAAKKSAKQLRG